MRYLFLIFLILAGMASSEAQQLTPSSLSAGGISGNSANYRIDATINQTAVGWGATDSCLLTEGVQQTGLPAIPDNLPHYGIGNIPSQTAYPNIEKAFYVYPEILGLPQALSYTWISSPPGGYVSFNPDTGKFSIVANEEDRGKYTVLFQAVINGDTLWQEVDIFVLPLLTPEQTAFGLEPVRDLPKEDGDDYVVVSLAENEGTIDFNHAVRKTYNYSIAGKTLVFDKALANKLQVFCTTPRSDVQEINLYAETIIIRSAVRFPQTHITIHARHLIFENSSEVGSINTMPDVKKPDPTQNGGANGLPAGNVELYLQHFSSNGGNRFRLFGGKGQGSIDLNGGHGGKGGELSSTLALSGFADVVGGTPGSGKPYGNKGVSGNFEYIPQKHSWLHPYALKMVIRHAKDAYLNGYMNYTQRTFEDYVAEIDDYRASSEWLEIPDADRSELDQLQSEMATMLYRIGNNLDYFGNPAGWVPMLSFEVNKLAFEEEVDRAIRVLYLAYWVQKADAGNQQKLQALEEAKGNLQNVLIDYQNNYNEAVKLLPQLEVEADEIIAEMEEIQSKIEQLEQELTERAKYIVEERHRPPKTSLWRKVARTVGTIAKVVPVYQPALGAIGQGLVTLSEINFNDPLGEIPKITDAVKEFKDVSFKASADQFKAEMAKIDFSNINFKSPQELKKYYDNLSETAKPIYDAVSGLREKVGNTNVPIEEIRVELDRMKAESPEYAELIAQANDLMTQKAQFQQKIAVTLQKISALSNNIQNGVLSVDGLNGEIFAANSKRDLRAMLYINDMEQRAKDRLVKYHYYMAKAFEYRLLTPYTQELDLSNMFGRIRDIVEGDDVSSVLTDEEFQKIKAIYDDVISSVTENILNIYNQNAPEISAPLRFNLTGEDLSLLNSGHAVHLNMVNRGMFPAYEENIRIRDFKVISIKTHYENGQPGTWAYSDLLLEHSGISKLKKDSEVYLFNHYNNENKNPIVWGMRFDAYDGLISPKEPSLYNESLLRSLLAGLNRFTTENQALYSRPAAWADIMVTKNDNTSNNVKIVYDEVRLEVTYDFQQRPTGQVNVEVSTNNDMKPLIQVSQPDKNERQDGWGSFIRTYFRNSNGSLTLEAPVAYGSWQFEKWTDFNHNFIDDNPKLIVKLGADQMIRANYLLIQPVLSVGVDTIYLPGNSGLETIAVQNTGTGEMPWSTEVQDGWISTDNIGSDLGNGYINLHYEANPAGTERMTQLVVIAPGSIRYLDTITVIQSMITGTNEVFLEDLARIYPNPTTGQLFIDLGRSTAPARVSVYNSLGALLLQIPLTGPTMSLDLSAYPKGICFVTVTVNGKVMTRKVLLE